MLINADGADKEFDQRNRVIGARYDAGAIGSLKSYRPFSTRQWRPQLSWEQTRRPSRASPKGVRQ
jgi:hypothetical protein